MNHFFGPALAYLLLLAVTLLAMAMGFLIVFQAYRGYRRAESRPMLYLAAGLALVTIAPFVLSLAAASVGDALGFTPFTYTYTLPIVSRLIEVVGLACILYSLYMRG